MEERAVRSYDTPHTMISDDLRQQRSDISRASGIDFKICNVSTFVLALNEFDLPRLAEFSLRSDTWPADVRAILTKEVASFSERNGGAQIVAQTTAIGGEPKAFITAIHWRPKA